MSGVIVIGAGGHAKVVADILLQHGVTVTGYLDDNPTTWAETPLGLPVLGATGDFQRYSPEGLVMGIGSNKTRREVVERLGEAAERLWCNAVHPRATLAPSVRLGRGVVIAAGAVINPDTVILDHAIVNTSASVDHDCMVGRFAHLAPGTRLAGGVTVGEGALLGVGSLYIPNLTIGAWAVVGAGAAVVRDVPAGVTARGVPARW